MRRCWLHTIWIVVAACRGVPPAQDSAPEDEEERQGSVEIDIDNDGSSSLVDCDDRDPTVYPEAKELCNDIDEDCDGKVDEGLDTAAWYVDDDGDGYGIGGRAEYACSSPPNTSRKAGDCDDDLATRHPGAEELCNGLDDDCDEEIDDGLVGDVLSYRDVDGDLYGDAGSTIVACAPVVEGYVDGPGDCDDANDDVNPSASEVCNGVDDDCDGEVDGPDALDATLWYTDVDGDGYGDSELTELACSAPPGAAAIAGDCDDGDGAAWPGASERCDGDDDDCDGEADESDAVNPSIWTRDADGDGYGAVGGASATACDEPYGYAASADDCDDTDIAVNPGAVELWNTGDDDCDGVADDGVSPDIDLVPTPGVTCLSDEGACGSGTASNGLDEDCDGNPDDDCDEDGDGDGQTPNGGDCDDDDSTITYGHKQGFDDLEEWLSDPGMDSANTLVLFGDVNGDGMQDTVMITTSGTVYAALATNTDVAESGDLQADAFVAEASAWWPPAGALSTFEIVKQYYASAITGDYEECESTTLLTPWHSYALINTTMSATTDLHLTATLTRLADVDGDADDDLVLYVGDLDSTEAECGNGCANGCNTASGPYSRPCDGFEGAWYVFRSNGSAFEDPSIWLDGAEEDDGYEMDEFYLADVNGDAASDLVAYSADTKYAIGCPAGCYSDPDDDGAGVLVYDDCGSDEVGWWAVAVSQDEDGDGTRDGFSSFTRYKTDFGCTFTGSSTCEVDWRGVADVNADGRADLVAADLSIDRWQVALAKEAEDKSFGPASTWRWTGATIEPATTLFDMDGRGIVWIEDKDHDGSLDPSEEVQTGVRLADVDGDLDADLVVIGEVDSAEGVHKWRVALAHPDSSGSGTFTGDLSASTDDDVWLKSDTSLAVSRYSVRNVSESDDDEAGLKTLADAIIFDSGTWYVAQAIGKECSAKEEL